MRKNNSLSDCVVVSPNFLHVAFCYNPTVNFLTLSHSETQKMTNPRGTAYFLRRSSHFLFCIIIGVTVPFTQGDDDFYFTKPGGSNDFWSSGPSGSRGSFSNSGSSDIVTINDGGFKKTVLDGEKRVTLECAVSDTTYIQYYWTLNGKPVENTTRRHQIGPNLYFARVIREHDSGGFACIAVNSSSGFSLTSPKIFFNIVWISPATTVHLGAPENAGDIKPGIEVILRCRVAGTSEIHFEWFRNGDPIRTSERLVIRGKRLHIKGIISNIDSGSYKCLAKNDAGVAAPKGKFVLSVLDEKYPRLLVAPQDIIAKEGEAARFDCAVNSSKTEVVQWFFHDNGPLSSSSRYVLYPNRTLAIPKVRREDEGIFKCLVTSISSLEDEPQIFSATLNIAYLEPLSISTSLDPPPIIPSHKLAVPEKGTVEIFCERPKGLPTPRLWWEGPDGKVIPEASLPSTEETPTLSLYSFPSARVREPNTLIVPNVKTDQTGKFSCVAENVQGVSRATVQLVVISTPPTILGHPSSTVVKEGETAYFMCQFRGPSYPVSQIQWLRNNVPIQARIFLTQDDQADGPILYPVVSSSLIEGSGGSNGGSNIGDGGAADQQKPFSRFVSFPENGTLKIEPVELTDVGDYTCEIMTPGYMTVDSRPAKLFVTETLKFMPKPVDRKLELGTTSKIHCKAHGASPLKIRWVKEGQSIFEWPSHIKEVNGTLHFHTVKHSDKGRYTCVATNPDGLINATIFVDVGVTPKFSVVPKNPTEVSEGNSILIDCKAYGDPTPTIQWDKNNMMNGFDHKRFRVFENGSLLISDATKEDEARYGCTAGSAAGFIREEVRLIVKSNDQYYTESLDDDAVMTRTVSITLSVAAGYMLLVIGLMLWCRHRQLKRKQAYLSELEKENGDEEMKDSGPINNGSAPLLIPNGHHIKAESCRESVKSDGETGKSTHSSIGGKIASATASITSHKSVLSQHSKRSGGSGYELISYPRNDLQFVMLLGHGDFGEVFLAKAKNIVKEKRTSNGNSGDREMLVMVKALQTRDESALFDYKREIDMYYKLSHENVTKLVKLCRDMDPHYMLLEYSDWGDLKQFLLATRKDNPRKVPKPPPLSVSQVLQVISQVALGMEHISNYRFVHKDLATRNCLISSGLKIQVSNPSLCRDTYANEYHKFKNQYIPVRWLPQEAVLEDDYSTKSDIWSFACLVWEVVHQAAIPLSHLSNEKVVEALEMKEILWDYSQIQNLAVPQRLQQLLIQCWDANPKNRPSFSSIVIMLSEISKESSSSNES